jgi:phage terminase small subunit
MAYHKDPNLLTPQQERFCLEYLKDLNSLQAAVRAGYSARTARAQGSRLLTYVAVKARIAVLQADVAAKAGITAQRVLEEIGRLAFSDVRKLFGENGSLRKITELSDAEAAAISSVETVEEFAGKGASREFIGYTKKLRLWDKKGALELLGKYLSMFSERVDVGGALRIEVVYVDHKANDSG